MPGIDVHFGMAQTGEPVLVAFIAEASIERLDVGVLIWLAGFNEEQLDTSGMRPCRYGPTAELLPVIGSDRFGQPAALGQLVEDVCELQPAHCSLRDDGHRFMSRVIDNGQVLDDTPFCRPVEYEIHRPHLVGCQGTF